MKIDPEIQELLNQFVTKEELENFVKSKGGSQDKTQMAIEMFDHMHQCKSDDCELHKYKDQLQDEAFIMGLLAGGDL